MSIKEENSISPETKEAVNALLEKLPPEELEKAVGGLTEKQKKILKRAGIAAGALFLLYAGRKLGQLGMFSPQEGEDMMGIINRCRDDITVVPDERIDTGYELQNALNGKNISVNHFKRFVGGALKNVDLGTYPAINNLIHPIGQG